MGNTKKIKGRQPERSPKPGSQQARSGLGRHVVWGGVAVAFIVLIVYIVIDTGGDSPEAAGAPEGTEVFAVGDPSHVTGPVEYTEDPPVGGPHSADDLPCGLYDQPVVNELAVHTLEHGAVWITYRPDIDVAGVALLNEILSGEDKVLLSPHPNQTASVVATAWARRLELEGPDDPRLMAFVETFRDGDAAPEPGVSCSRGIGEPPANPLAGL